MKRRDFLKNTAAIAAGAAFTGTGAVSCAGNGRNVPAPNINLGGTGRMELKFFPYELQLAHTFTVASYSRKTTPDVQVEIHYEGLTYVAVFELFGV